MALLEKKLIVKKSTLPGAGKGLFTKVSIPKGTRIVEYKGKIVTWKEVEAMADERNGYVFISIINIASMPGKQKKALPILPMMREGLPV
ncbi:MAG: SET domain-containing protein [Flammeovirgaceae bacterium]|nr:SET domain-containing protein [Flammeovirgaceae bacterium]